MRRPTGISLAILCLLAASAFPAGQSSLDISWEKEIRPALESLFCFEERRMLGSRDYYGIVLMDREQDRSKVRVPMEIDPMEMWGTPSQWKCGDYSSALASTLLEKIADAFLSKRHVIIQLAPTLGLEVKTIVFYYYDNWEYSPDGKTTVSKAPCGIALCYERAKKGVSNIDAVKARFLQTLFSEADFLRMIMPTVTAVLRTENWECPDCPISGERLERRSISLSDLKPYLYRYCRLVSFAKDDYTFDEHPIDPSDDYLLAIAAKVLLKGNWGAWNIARKIWASERASKSFRIDMRTKPIQEQIAYLNARALERLPQEKDFLKEALLWAKTLLPELGIDCQDCLLQNSSNRACK